MRAAIFAKLFITCSKIKPAVTCIKKIPIFIPAIILFQQLFYSSNYFTQKEEINLFIKYSSCKSED
jgi:hypothetical protein